MREKSPGYWQLRVYDGRDPITGKSHYRSRGFRGTKREAQSKLAAFVAEVNAGVVATAPMTVKGLFDAWLDHIEHLGRSPTTLYGYRRLVMKMPEGFMNLQLAKLTPKIIDDLYRHLGTQTKRKPATVLRFHTVLRAALSQGVRWGWIDRNPADRATPPRVSRREIQPPAIEDVIRVLEHAAFSRNPENALVFRILAATGCRRGEVCGLQWDDFQLDAEPPRVTIRRAVVEVDSEVYVQDTKTHAQRTVGLDDETVELVRAHLESTWDLARSGGDVVEGSDFVFKLKSGSPEPLPPDRLSQAWTRLCKELGVKARLHDLRHLQASLLLDAGEAITTVAARLGHRDTSTTLKVYGHLMPGADERAAGVVGAALARPTKDD
jgi:integrase